MVATPVARILIVDDEKPQMEALCNTLRDEGYATIGFTSANQALAALREQPFDLLLTDLMMPEMDGITLLRNAVEIDHDLVGVMMTGYGTIDTAVQAMKVGSLDYILKPFDLTVVLPVLARALAMRYLRRENAELAKQVRDHADELEAANKELEAFSYSVSHDLRAPLRAVSGFSQRLRKEGESHFSGQEKELLDRICSGATQMGELIEGLLNLSRLGRQPLTRRPISLATLVREALDGLAREREGRQIEIHISELPDCVGDPPLLRQVFANLLANAFKFTRQKEKAVIEISCLEKQGEKIYFVRDNGAGFDMQYAKKLFGAFQRLHTQEQFEGTGVGLSIVQRIIHRHGGHIWAEGEVDKGAAFYFNLGD
jgi:two-component system sensor histidine kinase/response regulator